MKGTPESEGGAAFGMFAAMDTLLSALAADAHLRDGTREAAAAAARGLFAARDEWQEMHAEMDRQRQQLATIREEVADLEKLLGRVYTALEEESWPAEPRRPA